MPIRNSKRAQRFYKADECDLILKGYIAFLAPPKESAGRAIRALQNDQPIKAIADVLGHRYIDTTYIYAKADLKTLRQVAMPWPKR